MSLASTVGTLSKGLVDRLLLRDKETPRLSPAAMVLCDACQELQFTADDFTYRLFADKNGEDRATTLSDDSPVLTSRFFDDIRRAFTCQLCRLVKHAIRVSQPEFQSDNTGMLSQWKLRNIHDPDQKTPYSYRVLEVVIHRPIYDSTQTLHLVPVRSDSWPWPFPGRLIKPEQIDLPLVNRWIEQCQQEHNGRCRHRETPQFREIAPMMHVIDTIDLNLSKMPPACRYAALTYVRGDTAGLSTNKANLNERTANRGLKSLLDRLPAAVRDAMELARGIGIRYLWVDSLCIVHDDNIRRGKTIEKMDLIFDNAFVTLVAASGTDANAGLPGVRAYTRANEQVVATVSTDLQLVFPQTHNGLKESVWASRAWTYQEFLFSNRCLIFYGGQVIYKCPNAYWREDLHHEDREKSLASYDIKLPRDWKRPQRAMRKTASRRFFARCCQAYMSRLLTDPLDILDAFAGVLDYAARDLGLDLHFGLTKAYFGLDILWMPRKWLSRRSGFPSWSWVGWRGPIIAAHRTQDWDRFMTDGSWLSKTSWISWYAFNENDKHFHLFSTPSDGEQEPYMHRRGTSASTVLSRSTTVEAEAVTPVSEMAKADATEAVNAALIPLLKRLSYVTHAGVPERRTSPLPLYLTPTISCYTILFRALTAHVFISPISPSGEVPSPPRDDFPDLPSTPNLYLYTADDVFIGTAWVCEKKVYDRIVETATDSRCSRHRSTSSRKTSQATTSNDSSSKPSATALQGTPLRPTSRNDRAALSSHGKPPPGMEKPSSPPDNRRKLLVEVALLTGPTDGDWRSRLESPTTWQYIKELAAAGVSSKELLQEFGTELENETKRSTMQSALAADSTLVGTATETETSGNCRRFWKCLLFGHIKEQAGEMLPGVGNVGGGWSGVAGGMSTKERIGIGELAEDQVAGIDGLAFRDVMLQ